MANTDTVERILDAASALFAERGFAETSLRSITSSANVNLAAVNYHFGSKKELIHAVFSRYLTPFCEQLDLELDSLFDPSIAGTPKPEELISILFSTLLSSMNTRGGSPEQFMRLLGLAYSQSQEHLRRSIMAEYGVYYGRFISLLSQAIPDLKPEVFYWRLYFMLGASVFTLSSFESIAGILKADYGKDSSMEDAVNILIPSINGMLVGPPIK